MSVLRWRFIVALVSFILGSSQLHAQDNTVFLESFSTDGDGIRYDMFGRGSDTSPDAWEITFAAAQSEAFPLGPGGEITLAAPRVAIPWSSALDNATADAFPIFDSVLSWATDAGSNLNVSFLAKDGATDSNLDPGDAALFTRLATDLGHTVSLFDASSITPEGVAASDVLLISDSVNVGDIYKSINVREVGVPVVNYNRSLADDLLLTVTEGSTQQLQSVDIRQPGSPILPSGFAQDQNLGLADARNAFPEYGVVRSGAQVLATYRGPFARNVSNLATVDAMIDGTAGSVTETVTITDADLIDTTDAAVGIWDFDNEIPGGGGNDFAIVARGTVTVSQTGDYVFGVGGDDGGRLRIGGQDVVVDDATHGFQYATGTVNLAEGDHEIEWIGFERGGGAGFELSFVPAGQFTGVIDNVDADVVSTAPFLEQVVLNEPGLEVTVHYLDVENSPDVMTNNAAVVAAAAGTTFRLPSAPFRGAVGDYLLGTDMDSIPGTSGVPPGIVTFRPIDLSGVADPKLTLNIAGTFGLDDGDGAVIFVNDEELTTISPNPAQILVDSATGALITPHFQSVTYDLPSGLGEATIRIEVSNNGSGEAVGIDEVRITDGDPDPSVLVAIPDSIDNRIQHGVNGYEGLEDTEIRFSQPDADLSEKLFLNPDSADDGGEVQVLTRFNDLIGEGDNQISAEANVELATFNINITGPGTPLALHRMLVPWEDDTATWNEFGNGVQADDAEAKAEADDVQQANAGITSWDITETIKAWQADPDSNFGWAVLPTGTNGADYLSAEAIDLDTSGLAVAPFIEFFLGEVAVGVPGDVDGDGDVDFDDFVILSNNFGGPGTAAQGDLDGNGEVGFDDFVILSNNFGATAAAAVPEPSSVILGLFSLLGLSLRRRRR